MASRNPLRTRNAAIAAALVIGFLGFSVGAVVNQGIGRLVVLPEDAKPIKFNDVPTEPGAPAPAPVVDGGEEPDDVVVEAPTSPATSPSGVRVPAQRSYVDSIVRRNIFDSSAVFDPNAAARDGGGECKEGGAKLLATVVADPPSFSSALIQMSGKDAGAEGYSIGDDVSGEGRIVSIEQKRVCLDGGSCLCMGGEKDRPVATTKGDTVVDDSGITKLSDNRFAVDQSVLDDAMGNFELLATQLKAYPHKGPDGQIDGYRLSSIRPSSLFAKLGIKNGDIVHAVNGTPLTSADGALAAYQALKNERSFSFELTRKNQKQTLEYEVR